MIPEYAIGLTLLDLPGATLTLCTLVGLGDAVKRILLLEDDSALNDLFAHFLSEYQVLRAWSAADAMSYLKDGEAPDAAIIDFWLVAGTAVPVLDALCDDYPQIPVLVISGGHQSFSPELTEAFSVLSRADLFLQKPFRMEDLLTALETALQTKPLN